MKLFSGDLSIGPYPLIPQKLCTYRITITLRVSGGILKLNLKILYPSLYENILGLIFMCTKLFEMRMHVKHLTLVHILIGLVHRNTISKPCLTYLL